MFEGKFYNLIFFFLVKYNFLFNIFKCFVKQVDLQRHERAATKLTESFCNKNLKSRQLNKSELLKQTGKPYQVIEENDLFICSSCGKVFLQRPFCVSHIRKHIDLEQGRFRCETCETNFGTNTELRRHAALKHGTSAGVERPRLVPIKLEQDEDGWFKCPECPERFQQRVTCTKHVKRHENLRSGKYRCDFESCEMVREGEIGFWTGLNNWFILNFSVSDRILS